MRTIFAALNTSYIRQGKMPSITMLKKFYSKAQLFGWRDNYPQIDN